MQNQSEYEQFQEKNKRRCVDCGDDVDVETWERNEHRCNECVADRQKQEG